MTGQGPFVSPSYQRSAYNCPFCGAYAAQHFSTLLYTPPSSPWTEVPNIAVAECRHCDERSIWFDGRMLHPSGGGAPHPNTDLPEDVNADYEEARSILGLSPRGAAALLRLAIQKLCVHLGEPGKNIDADIASLVRKGLPSTLQKPLDIVRVIGNEAVHPGTLDLNDDPQLAAALFGLVNLIAEKMITEPKEIDALYGTLPPVKREGIVRRDGKS